MGEPGLKTKTSHRRDVTLGQINEGLMNLIDIKWFSRNESRVNVADSANEPRFESIIDCGKVLWKLIGDCWLGMWRVDLVDHDKESQET